jgi:hypothetical protein
VRPYWKGYLKFALVSCPVALHAACSTAERIAFRQINTATGNRLRQQLIDEETREPVAPEYKGRGYEVAKGQYLIVDDAELEAIEIESTHTIEIDSFVPRAQIDQRFLDTTYYVMPNEPVGQDAFAIIREAKALLIAIAKAREWMDDLAHGRVASLAAIARREGKVERHIRLLAPLAFLSPRIVSAILDGTAPADLTITALARALPWSWAEQERRLGLHSIDVPNRQQRRALASTSPLNGRCSC